MQPRHRDSYAPDVVAGTAFNGIMLLKCLLSDGYDILSVLHLRGYLLRDQVEYGTAAQAACC